MWIYRKNFLKTGINRGNRDKKKTNLRLKGCLGKSKKSLSCEILREVNTVETKTQLLPFGHFLKSIHVLSQNNHKKTLVYTNSCNKFGKILLNKG